MRHGLWDAFDFFGVTKNSSWYSLTNVSVRDVSDKVSFDAETGWVVLGRLNACDLQTDGVVSPRLTTVPVRGTLEYVTGHDRTVCNTQTTKY